MILGDPYIPTPPDLIRAKLDLAEADENDVVFDLGCGDGRVMVIAATEYGARGVGVELQEGVVEEAWSQVADHQVEDRVEVFHEDYLETDLSSATLLVLYLTTRTLCSISEKLREVQPGTRIVTHDFALPAWDLSEQGEWESEDGQLHSLYLYRKS